jgi:hypothetical protein
MNNTIKDLFKQASDEVLMAKFSYWFSL